MSEQIFISYRRADACIEARLLRIFLEKCGYSAFMDMEINRQSSFPKEIRKKISQCTDFVLIVSDSACCYRENSDGENPDWLFDEMKCAYDLSKQQWEQNAKNKIRLHVMAMDNETMKRFSAITNVPDEYKDAYNAFKTKTPELQLSIFKTDSDSAILTNLRHVLDEYYTKSHSGSVTDVQSVYDPSARECERLNRQSRSSSLADREYMQEIVTRLRSREGCEGKLLNVLDVGCAVGDTGQRYFGDKTVFGKVLGIDLSQKCVEQAVTKYPPDGRFFYRCINISDKEFAKSLDKFRRECMGEEKFDIIFCCQVLHHAARAKQALGVLEEMLNDGGCLIIRGSDDATKLLYNPSSKEDANKIVTDIISLTNEMPTIADRQYGRKIFSQLQDLGLSDVRVFPICESNSMVDAGGQNHAMSSFYKMSFAWREEIFEPLPGDPEEKRRDLSEKSQKMKGLLERLHTVMRPGAWFMQIDFFGYGFKLE